MSNSSFSIGEISTLLRQGRPHDAEPLLRSRLSSVPTDENALTLLGICLQQQGRSEEAVEAYRQLTRQTPLSAIYWCNLGTALRQAGQNREAESAFLHAIEIKPDFDGALLNLGFLCMDGNDYRAARDYFLRAHEIRPSSPEARIYAAQMCFTLDDRELADRLIEPRQQWGRLEPDLMLELGILLIHYGSAEEGTQIFERLLRDDPGNHRARSYLVVALERINRLDEARQLLAQLPLPNTLDDADLNDEVVDAHVVVALRDRDTARARELLERATQTPSHQGATASERPAARPHSHSNLFFALAKACDKQGDSDATMRALAKAHERQLELVRRSEPELLNPGKPALRAATIWIDSTERAAWSPAPAPDATQSPIFIVGFPRSGTTMLEQMLDAHPGLQAMDERAFLQYLVERMSTFGYAYPHDLGKLSAAQVEELRDLYWSLTAKVAPRKEGQRLVDKNPLNMLRLPLINRLFPEARIILALRHPCDVILSNYMQYYRSNVFDVLCSSLPQLAEGYVAAMRFWLHHADLLKPAVMNLRYEDLLDDFAGNVARIGVFLGLDDAAPLARFDQHARDKGFISTPSYTQVVEPPNKKAVDRWRRYQQYFEPVLPTLQPIMQHWGYDA